MKAITNVQVIPADQEAPELKTNSIMQGALIKAGLLTQDRATIVNTILKEDKRKAERRAAKERKKLLQQQQAAMSKARWDAAKN